jgi:hypothetical protein
MKSVLLTRNPFRIANTVHSSMAEKLLNPGNARFIDEAFDARELQE